jgi:tRNA-binding protein
MDQPPTDPGQEIRPDGVRPFAAAGSATVEDFARLDLRVGRIVDVQPFPKARRPAYRLVIDLGPGGTRTSSAQLPPTYPDPEALKGRLVIVVANFKPRRVAGFESQVLVLGALPMDGSIPLLGVDDGASPGDPVG